MTRQSAITLALNSAPAMPIVLPEVLLKRKRAATGAFQMTQTNNRFFDEIGRLLNDAAGAAQGVKREVDTVVRNQAEVGRASCRERV